MRKLSHDDIGPAIGGGTGSPRAGFTLIEVILVVLLVALTIVPIFVAFSPARQSTQTQAQSIVFLNQARGTLNRALSLPFSQLDGLQSTNVSLSALFGSVQEAAKEDFTFQGVSYTPILAIQDASGGTGGLVEVSVSLDPLTLKTLKADY